MAWIIFFSASVVVVLAAIKLAEYGDVIAVRSRLGGLLVGTILLAGATSLPELITAISSFQQGAPDLAAGSFFGSNMVNMFLLAFVDMVNYQVPLLRSQCGRLQDLPPAWTTSWPVSKERGTRSKAYRGSS